MMMDAAVTLSCRTSPLKGFAFLLDFFQVPSPPLGEVVFLGAFCDGFEAALAASLPFSLSCLVATALAVAHGTAAQTLVVRAKFL